MRPDRSRPDRAAPRGRSSIAAFFDCFSVGKFALLAALALPLSAIAYAWMLPFYERALVALVGVFRGDAASSGIDPQVVLLNIAILPALLLATPGRWSRRLCLACAAPPVLLALDAAVFALLLATRARLSDGSASILDVSAWGILMTSGQTTAMLAWALYAGTRPDTP